MKRTTQAVLMDGKVIHSYLHPEAGTVTGKTINEILESGSLSPATTARLFATGRYQTITPTLKAGKEKLKLTGDEKCDADMQERFFREFAIEKAWGKLAASAKRNEGTVENAQYAASQEWASIAAPNGKGITGGRILDGSGSYYESAANSANSKSTQNCGKF